MVILTPDFSDPDNWAVIGEKRWTKTINPDGFSMGEIGEVVFPFILERPTLAATVHCIAPDPPETWHFGGKVIFKTSTGITDGATSDGVVGVKTLYLDQINLIFLPNYGNNFTCGFFPPKWFNTVELTIWEYIGVGIPNNTTKLDYIGGQVDAIRAAVEAP